MPQPKGRRLLGFAAASLLWLPAGIVLLTLIRGFGLPPEADSWLLLAVTAPCGLPLALAWLALRRAGWETDRLDGSRRSGAAQRAGRTRRRAAGSGWHRRLYARAQLARLDGLRGLPISRDLGAYARAHLRGELSGSSQLRASVSAFPDSNDTPDDGPMVMRSPMRGLVAYHASRPVRANLAKPATTTRSPCASDSGVDAKRRNSVTGRPFTLRASLTPEPLDVSCRA